MTTNSLIVMTALPPTTGHRDLIEFSSNLADKTWVLIFGLSKEPISGFDRKWDLKEEFSGVSKIVVRNITDDSAPQNPEDHPDFWNWWKNAVIKAVPEVTQWDYVVASETYGGPLAEVLGAQFMPLDIDRELNSTKATDVRNNLRGNWNSILRATRSRLQVTGVVFGQESVGKTTVSKYVAQLLNGTWGFEYARPYLEAVGPDIDLGVMERIHLGQAALQRSLHYQAKSPFIILDTDLWSTFGYYPILDQGPAPEALIQDAHRLAGDMYYVLDDGIPFEEDILRYGGDKRTTTKQFWIDILEEEGLPYTLVPLGDVEEEAYFIANHLLRLCAKKNKSLIEYKRD